MFKISDENQTLSIAAALTLIERSLDDNKAEDILSINLTGKTAIADFMVIANGRSQRQVAALTGHILQKLKDADWPTPKVEGLPRADWVVIDAGDIIVHLFRPEVRFFYNLEKIWAVDIAAVDRVG